MSSLEFFRRTTYRTKRLELSILDTAANRFLRGDSDEDTLEEIRYVIEAIRDSLRASGHPTRVLDWGVTIDWVSVCGFSAPSYPRSSFFAFYGWHSDPNKIYFNPIVRSSSEARKAPIPDELRLEGFNLETLTTDALVGYARSVAEGLSPELEEERLAKLLGRPRRWKVTYLNKVLPDHRFSRRKVNEDFRLEVERLRRDQV